MSETPLNLIFDTQSLIDWAKGNLPGKVVRALRKPRTIYYSIVAPWELVIKRRYQLIGLDLPRFWDLVDSLEAVQLDIKRTHLQKLEEMPVIDNHRCPYDRMIIAQALTEKLTLVGADRRFPLYEGLNVLWQ